MQFSPIRVFLLRILHNYELFELKFTKKTYFKLPNEQVCWITCFSPFFMKQMFFTMLAIFHIKDDKRFSSIFMYSVCLLVSILLCSIFTSEFSEIVLMSRSSFMNFLAKPWSLLFFKQRKSSKKLKRIVGI